MQTLVFLSTTDIFLNFVPHVGHCRIGVVPELYVFKNTSLKVYVCTFHVALKSVTLACPLTTKAWTFTLQNMEAKKNFQASVMTNIFEIVIFKVMFLTKYGFCI